MGHVKKEGSSWSFVTELGKDPLTGKRKRIRKRGFKTKREAEKALALVESDIYKGTYIKPSEMYYKEHLEEWFKIKQSNISIQTADVYKGYMNKRIIPVLGQVKLSQLTPIILQGYINDLKEEGLASGTIKKIYNIIKGSLDHAVNMELLPTNPVKKVQLPKDKKKEMTVWDINEIKAFLDVAKKDRYYIAFHLAITTGMRRGEILGLRWKDINFENGTLSIQQTLSKDGKRFLSGAKTESSVRTIKLSNETLVVLKKQRAFIAKEKLQSGPDYQDFDLIVCTSKGTPVNPENLKRTFERLVCEADIRKIRFHDLRHTHATMLLAQGIHAKVISERLGHSNIKTTLDIYSHVLPTMQEEAANQIDALLSNSN